MALISARLVLENIFKLLCLVGFLYQSNVLLNDYLMGKTSISLEVRRLTQEPLPALTLCTQNWLSMRSLANFSETSESYDKYMKLFEEYFQNYHGLSPSKNVTDIHEQMDKIYLDVKNYLVTSTTAYLNGFKDFALKVNDLNFKIGATGSQKGNMTIVQENFNLRNPVESSIIIGDGIYKCFTFNSFLRKDIRDIKVKLNAFFMRISISYHTISKLSLMNPMLFSIHSPNSLPNLNDLTEFDPKRHTVFSITQVNTELLGEGFETNCYDYDLDHKFANFNMRSDCITSCVRYTSIKNRTSPRCTIVSNLLIRYEMQEQEECDLEVNQESFIFDLGREHRCQDECRLDCSFRYYIINKKDSNYPVKSIGFESFIKIEHGDLPDILIKYMPHTLFISLACNFGGLLGMWLGLSIISTWEILLNSLTKLIQKRKRILRKIKQIFRIHYCINSPKIIITIPNIHTINFRQR